MSILLRKLFIFYLPALLFPFLAAGQELLQVAEGTNSCSLGSQASYSVSIPQAKLKEVKSAWKKYVRQGTKKSAEEDGNEIILSQAVLPALGPDTFTVIARTEAADNGVQFTTFYHWNDSLFMSSSIDGNQSEKIKSYVRTFALQQYKIAVEDQLSENQKTLKSLDNDLEELISSNEQSERKIKEHNRSIDQLKDEIKTTEKELELKSEEVIRQKMVVESFTGTPEARELEEKKLRELNKQKKKLIDRKENMHKDIDDYEKKIKDRERSIEKNKSELIPVKKDEITRQKEINKGIEEKLKGIH